MGILSYVLDKFVSQSDVLDKSVNSGSGITVTKFVFVTGSIALVLFGMGYALYGLGSVVKPVSDIVEEICDSDSDSENIDNIEDSDSDNIEK